MVTFAEEIEVRKLWMRPFVKSCLKRQEKQHLADLKKALGLGLSWGSCLQLIANLLVEDIGCECFQRVVQQVEPKYVSCVIQINTGVSWVSDSPYLHVFDGLKRLYHQIDAAMLRESMSGIGYHYIGILEYPLPNGKKLVRLDFEEGVWICCFLTVRSDQSTWSKKLGKQI